MFEKGDMINMVMGPSLPFVLIEIFSSTPYRKGKKVYYLRGQRGYIIDKLSRNTQIPYYLQILVLINKSHKDGSQKGIYDKSESFGRFAGRTQKQHISLRKKYLDSCEECKIDIDLNKLSGLVGSHYVQERIKSNCDIILLAQDLQFDDPLHIVKNPGEIPWYEKRSYGLLARNYSESILNKEISSVHRTLEMLFDKIVTLFDYKRAEVDNCKAMLIETANLAYQWIASLENFYKKGRKVGLDKNGFLFFPSVPISPDFLIRMRDFQASHRTSQTREKTKDKDGIEGSFETDEVREGRIKRKYDPLREFCGQFFDDLVDDMVKYARLKVCKNCFGIITDKKRMTYCDNKCLRSYHNRKHDDVARKEKKKKDEKRSRYTPDISSLFIE